MDWESYVAFMEPYRIWIRGTALSDFVNTNGLWLWPLSESIHFLGVSLLIGTVGLFDLRMLGMAKGLSLTGLHRTIKLGITGYILNFFTGVLFFSSAPDQYMYNSAFLFKLLFMAIAGVNILFFYTMVFHRIKVLEPGEDAPLSGKIIGAVSLLCWIGVMSAGRLITFYRP
jgi:hypothetical protein